MQVRYGNICAWCHCCGWEEFELIAPEQSLGPSSIFVCCRCGAWAEHRELMWQIGDEALRDAMEALRTMKQRHEEYRIRIAALQACVACAHDGGSRRR